MGILNSIRNTAEKSKAAVIVENVLAEIKEDVRVMGGIKNHKKLATNLVDNVWDEHPDVFSGKFGQRPNKITVAAAAFGHELDRVVNHTPPLDKGYPLLINVCLGMILAELEKNGRLYPFNSLDDELLKVTVKIFEDTTDDIDENLLGG